MTTKIYFEAINLPQNAHGSQISEVSLEISPRHLSGLAAVA
jgi:hypothetical protein